MENTVLGRTTMHVQWVVVEEANVVNEIVTILYHNMVENPVKVQLKKPEAVTTKNDQVNKYFFTNKENI